MKILVTGAAGFVGSHLVDHLLSFGHEVWGLDNFLTGNRENIEHLSGDSRFTFSEHDVTKEFSQGLNVKFDRVYHLASPASPIDYVELPFQTLDAGSKATENCLNLCWESGARFLLASTSEVYGDPTVHPQVEGYWGNVNPIGPRSVYDEAKRYAEALTMAYQRYRGVETRIARIFNTYGPRMRPNDGRVMPTFINQALRGEALTVFGDGYQTRSFCYVSDLVRGIERLMESNLNTPCNIGNSHELTMNQLAEHINAFTKNHAGTVHRSLPQDDPTQRKPDITLARESLGWEPEVGFGDGVERTVNYFRESVK